MMDEPHDKEAKRKMMAEAMVKAEEKRKQISGKPISNPHLQPIKNPIQSIGVRG